MMKVNDKILEIVDSSEIIASEYEDILELATKCKFSDCTHTTEPDCAVKKAISDNSLLEEHFHRYYRAKNEAEYVSVKKNKTKAIDYMKKLKLFDRP